jgi:hypothetical protein
MHEDDGEEPQFDEVDDELGDDTPDEGGAEVSCPYCGEIVTIQVDAGGGAVQEYVEDCPVCCQPWSVHVRITRAGDAEVSVQEL